MEHLYDPKTAADRRFVRRLRRDRAGLEAEIRAQIAERAGAVDAEPRTKTRFSSPEKEKRQKEVSS